MSARDRLTAPAIIKPVTEGTCQVRNRNTSEPPITETEGAPRADGDPPRREAHTDGAWNPLRLTAHEPEPPPR